MNVYLKNFRQLFIAVTMIMDYFNCQPANAQFVNIILEIPSKSSIRVSNTGINKSRKWCSVDNNYTAEKLLQNRIDKSTLNRIEITTSGNMQMGIEIIPDGSVRLPEAVYLNCETPDEFNAVSFMGPRAVFPMNNGRIFSENKMKNSKCFKAWLLMPADKVSQIIFEYN